MGTPVVFRGGGVAVGDWEIPDGVKGEVVRRHFHEFQVRLFPPLPGDPRFAKIERQLEREGKGRGVEDLDIWVYKRTAQAGNVWPLVDTWAQYQPAKRHQLPRSQRSWLKPNAKRRSTSKDINRLIRRAQKQGWKVETTSGNHLKWTPSDPRKAIVITAATPSDYRAFRNIKARLRRSGLKLSA